MGHFRELAKTVVISTSLGRSVVWPLARTVRRYRFARGYYSSDLRKILRWAPKWTEDVNYYYDLHPLNVHVLESCVSAVAAIDVHKIAQWTSELDGDVDLRNHIQSRLSADPTLRDARVGYGRRLGWYLFVRAVKPEVVVETGVSHGVGACVIASALLKNREEGFSGRYLGTDIDPKAGILFTQPYSEVGELVYGDSLETLRSLSGPIDLFINDSDHSETYERQEYDVVLPLLSSESLILGDNSHLTDELRSFAVKNDRPYLFFREDPRDHWYPGGGIGISPASIPLHISKLGANHPSMND